MAQSVEEIIEASDLVSRIRINGSIDDLEDAISQIRYYFNILRHQDRKFFVELRTSHSQTENHL